MLFGLEPAKQTRQQSLDRKNALTLTLAWAASVFGQNERARARTLGEAGIRVVQTPSQGAEWGCLSRRVRAHHQT